MYAEVQTLTANIIVNTKRKVYVLVLGTVISLIEGRIAVVVYDLKGQCQGFAPALGHTRSSRWHQRTREFKQTAEDDDGNLGKTIRLITEDKSCALICEIEQSLVSSCSRAGLQMLHFYVVLERGRHFEN